MLNIKHKALLITLRDTNTYVLRIIREYNIIIACINEASKLLTYIITRNLIESF